MENKAGRHSVEPLIRKIELFHDTLNKADLRIILRRMP